jgi:hypothetical protein
MFQNLFKFLSILAIAILCFYCISNPKNEIQYNGEKSKLSKDVFKKLDYKVKEFSDSLPDEWHKTQFQTVWQRTYFVKRNTSVKEEENTYPRFWVREEVYETEDLAAERLKRIEDKPPQFINEEYWIVTGFQHQKNVYFIRTDSVLFSYYMKDFADKLAAEIQK